MCQELIKCLKLQLQIMNFSRMDGSFEFKPPSSQVFFCCPAKILSLSLPSTPPPKKNTWIRIKSWETSRVEFQGKTSVDKPVDPVWTRLLTCLSKSGKLSKMIQPLSTPIMLRGYKSIGHADCQQIRLRYFLRLLRCSYHHGWSTYPPLTYPPPPELRPY